MITTSTRVIPAPAGQPGWAGFLLPRPGGHPRTCGAAARGGRPTRRPTGSSPHLRGSHAFPDFPAFHCGVIPAPAGQPSCWRDWRACRKGHPRTCGAAIPYFDSDSGIGGSSPHLRGSRERRRAGRGPPGVIPAPAGQPITDCIRCPPIWGHPRTCGAARSACSGWPSTQGSSPHLRGSLRTPGATRAGARVIPAPAGQPGRRQGRLATPGGHPRTCGAALNSAQDA